MSERWPRHYVLDDAGDPLLMDDMLAWARWWETADRRVAFDTVGEVEVSTVFLAINHQWLDGPPVLWETLVFGGPLDGECNRYATRDAAIEGHAAMLVRVTRAAGL